MSRKSIPESIIYIAIAAVAGLLFIPFLGGVNLFDWDEINFAESAREMIVSGDYLTVRINFAPFWEKPPLFIWMQVLSMKMFGINEFAARFPNAICGIITLLVLYSIGKKNYDKTFGWLWVMAYAGSLLPFIYFKSGIIDPWFNLFIFLGIYRICLYFALDSRRKLNISLSALFIGLAILTKGPVALLIFLLTILVFALWKKFRVKTGIADILLFSVILIVTGGCWFLLQILHGNFSILTDFVAYQINLFKTRGAGHGGFPLYHVIVLLAGVFPASVLAVPALFRKSSGDEQQVSLTLVMKILFWVVLVLFSVVRTKIVHYSSLCYFPLTFLAAAVLSQAFKDQYKIRKYWIWIISGMGILYGIVFFILSFFDRMKSFLLDRIVIEDPFALACIKADAGWRGFEWSPAVILLTGIFLLLWWTYKSKVMKGWLALFISSCFFIYGSLFFFTPRIERYSQHAAVEFFRSVSDEDAYLETLGYKSYTHLFYGQVKPVFNPDALSREWLLTGDIDKKAYFSLRVDKKNKYLSQYPELKILYEKNGFVFCIREPR